MAKEKFTFQAEVSKLLDIVAHSLYTHKDIFLRELISNASDACERRSYAALTRPELIAEGGARIVLSVDEKKRTLSVADNGIGMNRDDLVDSLGTIARSGTQAFIEQLGKDAEGELTAIGQFGVGFYSTFMVAKKVEVVSRKAGEEEAWLWTSGGGGEFTIADAKREAPGTTVTLHMNKEGSAFLDEGRIRNIVKTHSDHIGIPIVLKAEGKEETLNTASALWTRPRKEIGEEQYKEFYHHVGHVFDEPWLILHNSVEGVVSYTNLLFIPSTPPFDLFQPERKQHLKLYVKRVFITDDCEGLLPAYLRFLSGVVDSEDLSLNISRETLQHDPKLAKIRKGLVKRVLGELKKKRDKDTKEYAAFWDNFGAVLKEGIYEDLENRDKILEISLFRSTASDEPVGLDAYVGRMRDGQEAIYYIAGEELEQLAKSPQLEGFKARGVEVLLLTDPIDEFWIPTVGAYNGKPFKSVTRGGADLGKIAAGADEEKSEEDGKEPAAALDSLVKALKEALGESVKDVRVSERLTESPVCLVSGEGDMDMQLERMLRRHKQLGRGMPMPRILEINPRHPLIRRLAELAKDGGEDVLADAAHLLLDQARIVEGEPLPDPGAFSRRLAGMLEKGLA